MSDEARLRRSLTQEVFKGDKGEILEGLASNPDPEKEFAAVFADGYVLLGKTENMRAGLVALRAESWPTMKELQTVGTGEFGADRHLCERRSTSEQFHSDAVEASGTINSRADEVAKSSEYVCDVPVFLLLKHD